MPAEKLEDIYIYFKTKSMEMDEFDELYVPADKGRGGKPACGRLKRRLVQEPLGCLKILFAGYKGCGKSTELLRLQKQIDKEFVVLNFSVMTEKFKTTNSLSICFWSLNNSVLLPHPL